MRRQRPGGGGEVAVPSPRVIDEELRRLDGLLLHSSRLDNRDRRGDRWNSVRSFV